jgi:hypothetical protein
MVETATSLDTEQKLRKGVPNQKKHDSCKKSMKQIEVLIALAPDYRLLEYDSVYFGTEVGLPTVAKYCW